MGRGGSNFQAAESPSRKERYRFAALPAHLEGKETMFAKDIKSMDCIAVESESLPILSSEQANQKQQRLADSHLGWAEKDRMRRQGIDLDQRLRKEPITDPANFARVLEGYRHPELGWRTVVHKELPITWGKDPKSNCEANGYGDLSAYITIYDDKHRMRGFTSLTLSRDKNDALYVYTGMTDLDVGKEPENNKTPFVEPEANEGKGFFRDYYDHVGKAMAKQNVERMSLHASYMGVYAWAKLGYDFDTSEEHDRQGNNTDYAARKLAIGQDFLAQLIDEAHRKQDQQSLDELLILEADQRLDPLSLASVGKTRAVKQTRTSWFGLDAMGEWYGTKWLFDAK